MNSNQTIPTSGQPQTPPPPMPDQGYVQQLPMGGHPQQPMAGYPQQPPMVVVERTRNGMAVASMVLGILAVVTFWIPFLNVISYVFAIIAIGLGIAAMVKSRRHKVGRGMAIAGLVMAAVSFVGATAVNNATVDAIDESISSVTVDADEVDVTLGEPTTDQYGYTTITVTMTNTSDENQSPWVTVSAESADGTELYDTGHAIVNDLKPGQTTTQEITFTEDIPSDATFTVSDLD